MFKYIVIIVIVIEVIGFFSDDFNFYDRLSDLVSAADETDFEEKIEERTEEEIEEDYKYNRGISRLCLLLFGYFHDDIIDFIIGLIYVLFFKDKDDE